MTIFCFGENHTPKDSMYKILLNLTDDEFKRFIKEKHIKRAFFEFLPSSAINFCIENPPQNTGNLNTLVALFPKKPYINTEKSIQDFMAIPSNHKEIIANLQNICKTDLLNHNNETINFEQLVKNCGGDVNLACKVLTEIACVQSGGSIKADPLYAQAIEYENRLQDELDLYTRFKDNGVDVYGIEDYESYKTNAYDERNRLETLNNSALKEIELHCKDFKDSTDNNSIIIAGNGHFIEHSFRPLQIITKPKNISNAIDIQYAIEPIRESFVTIQPINKLLEDKGYSTKTVLLSNIPIENRTYSIIKDKYGFMINFLSPLKDLVAESKIANLINLLKSYEDDNSNICQALLQKKDQIIKDIDKLTLNDNDKNIIKAFVDFCNKKYHKNTAPDITIGSR